MENIGGSKSNELLAFVRRRDIDAKQGRLDAKAYDRAGIESATNYGSAGNAQDFFGGVYG